MTFRALIVNKIDEQVSATVENLNIADLPDGEVLVSVEYSTLNYKDGLCLTGNGGLVRNYPHIAGIDFAGTVEQSSDERYSVGDKVVLTGWRVGEVHWGGYAQKARVKADWLVPLPSGLSSEQAMSVGTAGLTAMLAINALQEHGLSVSEKPVLVTGATGGVGSVATAILANLGFKVAALTGRTEHSDYLKNLGAEVIVLRDELNEPIKRPLESETYSGAVDSVGGVILARALGQMSYGASIAAVGLAGSANLPATVIPFLLRGVNLLGIDSVMQPYKNRVQAWEKIAHNLPFDKFESSISRAKLSDLPKLGEDILKGKVRGRVVVDVNA